MWTLGKIWLYPIKSLPGVSVTAASITAAGNLQGDREWALMDREGSFLNGKRTAAIHQIKATWDWPARQVTVSTESHAAESFRLDDQARQLAEWCSDIFHMPLTLEHQPNGGFPDDQEASGPTLISQATLQTVARWFPGLSVDEIQRRFRANLELRGGQPFEEDRLYGPHGTTVPFLIGSAKLWGSNPCQRCVVPTRDSASGDVWTGFQKQFARLRETQLPDWAERSRFNHFYRLAVNTIVRSTEPQPVAVGDVVTVSAAG